MRLRVRGKSHSNRVRKCLAFLLYRVRFISHWEHPRKEKPLYIGMASTQETDLVENLIHVLCTAQGSNQGPSECQLSNPRLSSRRLKLQCSGTWLYTIRGSTMMSLKESRIPKEWKKATITPIYKGGSKKEPLNYRPVTHMLLIKYSNTSYNVRSNYIFLH